MPMTSTASNSTGTSPTTVSGGPPRRAVASMVVTMARLAALLGAFRPLASDFAPAPLQPVPKGCPCGSQEFVPSNLTALPDLPLDKLCPKVKNRVLLRLNMEPCDCGCARSIAACLASVPPCESAKELAKKILAEEAKETSLAP
jgi:hypothetical protein